MLIILTTPFEDLVSLVGKSVALKMKSAARDYLLFAKRSVGIDVPFGDIAAEREIWKQTVPSSELSDEDRHIDTLGFLSAALDLDAENIFKNN